MSSFFKKELRNKNREGGIIKLLLFLVALILLLAYFGISFSDVQENKFVQFLMGLFISFFN